MEVVFVVCAECCGEGLVSCCFSRRFEVVEVVCTIYDRIFDGRVGDDSLFVGVAGGVVFGRSEMSSLHPNCFSASSQCSLLLASRAAVLSRQSVIREDVSVIDLTSAAPLHNST